MELNIRRYRSEDKRAWDEFVKISRNGTFLFERDYMDYHSDRFTDCSWIATKGNRIIALLPANIDPEGCLHSHQGLTYGGWILPPAHLDGAGLLEIFRIALEKWKEEGIKTVDYKSVPYIYCSQPSDEDQYSLFRLGAQITEINLSSAIDLSKPPIYNKLRKRALKKSAGLEYRIHETSDAERFMNLVNRCLMDRHSTAPVHTAAEVELLRSHFPENISMYLLSTGEGEKCEDEAGVMIYDTGRVAHAQYIATSEQGREDDLLTPLFDYLIRDKYKDCAYFDFGISNENHGLYLNEGLLRQKFSYGATGVSYCRWNLKL